MTIVRLTLFNDLTLVDIVKIKKMSGDREEMSRTMLNTLIGGCEAGSRTRLSTRVETVKQKKTGPLVKQNAGRL